MSQPDSWFERNAGFIAFMGHVAAIEQRNVVINQLANANASANQTLEIEQRRESKERQEQQRRDTLYDVDQAVKLIEGRYKDKPEQGLYEVYLLKSSIDAIGVHHSWFSDLQWKDKCTATLSNLLRVVNAAYAQLSKEQVASVNARLENYVTNKRREEEENQKALLLELETAQEAKHLAEKSERALAYLFLVLIAVVLLAVVIWLNESG
jgi:hypothetical protein